MLDESDCINLFVLTLDPIYVSACVHVYRCLVTISRWNIALCSGDSYTHSRQRRYPLLKYNNLRYVWTFSSHFEVSSNVKVKSVQTCITMLLSASGVFFWGGALMYVDTLKLSVFRPNI